MMHKLLSGAALFMFAGILLYTAVTVFAGNPPDQGKSTISGTAAPADGLTSSSVTIVLRDSSNNPLSGSDTVDIKSSDSTTMFNPSTVTLDGSGTIYTQMKSSYVGNVPVAVVDDTTGTTITGTVLFYQPGGSPPTPGACTDAAPGSTARLTSAVSAGAHSITLTWTDATNPVSYYLLSYGLSSGNYIYGNPNIGGQGTTSYTVGGLATGTKYFFVVRAGNGCTPGSYSNELSAVAGAAAATPTPASAPADTTATTSTDQTATDTPTPTATPMPAGQSSLGGASPTPAPTGGSTVGTIVMIGTVLGILIFAGIGVWMFVLHRQSRRPPMMYH